jgi:hypothetical protein
MALALLLMLPDSILVRVSAFDFRRNFRRIQFVALVFALCLFVINAYPQSERPIWQDLKLNALKQSPTRCEVGIESQFLDDTHLLVSNPICTKGGIDSAYQIAILSFDGTISASVGLDNNSSHPYVGPRGYIFIPAGRRGWLIYDDHLHQLGSVPAQTGESESVIVLSPSRSAVALIFTGGDGYSYPWRFVVLAGEPLERKSEYTISEGSLAISDSGSVDKSANGKARHYEFSAGEIWYFDEANNYQLSRRSSTGTITVLPDARWLSPDKTETWCSGQISTVKPPRFLAHCAGDTSIGFGKASVGWGHSRFVVYDAQGSTLVKKTVSGTASVSLSPDGRLLAISGGRSIQLSHLR